MKETLYSIAKNGTTDMWTIEVRDNAIHTTYGKVDGKQQQKVELIEAGKNIGRANETTPAQQAILEARSKLNKQLDKGYRYTVEQAQAALLENATPQLAKDYLLASSHIDYSKGVLVQPKLDGVRLWVDSNSGTVRCLSRSRKEFPQNDGLWQQIATLVEHSDWGFLDGEMYLHGADFQKLISCVKKPQGNELADLIEFHIFDLPSEKTYHDSHKQDIIELAKLIKRHNLDRIKIVETTLVYSEEAARLLMNEYLLQGYEGIMLRNQGAVYELNNRSYNLQKWKDFDTDEYMIVDIIADKDGNGLYLCSTDNGVKFNVTPKLPHAERKGLLLKLGELIGKLLTVKFQGLTTEGLPRFGVGLTIRDYE